MNDDGHPQSEPPNLVEVFATNFKCAGSEVQDHKYVNDESDQVIIPLAVVPQQLDERSALRSDPTIV